MKIEKRRILDCDYAVFEVPIRDNIVFMKEALYLSDSDKYFVIWVDRARFESVWFKYGCSVAPELARGNEDTWRNDYKFHYAEKGFSFGVENPVPLANMTTNKDYPSVGFINGITRTIWLLANGAQYFPAFVFDKEVANKLHRFFGVKGSRVLSNNELFFQLNERGFRT